jgi:hypothetical protein
MTNLSALDRLPLSRKRVDTEETAAAVNGRLRDVLYMETRPGQNIWSTVFLLTSHVRQWCYSDSGSALMRREMSV